MYKLFPNTCEVSICNNLLSIGKELLGLHFNRETYIKPVAHCFNCQKFDDISTNCFRKHGCECSCEQACWNGQLFSKVVRSNNLVHKNLSVYTVIHLDTHLHQSNVQNTWKNQP